MRPLWKRSLFWVSRLVCTPIVVLLGSCSRSGCPAVDAHDVFGPVSAHHLANLSDLPRGFLGTRVGEASHPGPPDILGAALSEANPYTNQEVPVTINFSSEPTHTVLPTSPSIPMPPDPGSLPPTSGSTSLRRPVPQDSAQHPVSKRRAAASGRWYLPFSAMKGHCDRHLGGYSEGELPLDWLREVGYGVCEVCNRILHEIPR